MTMTGLQLLGIIALSNLISFILGFFVAAALAAAKRADNHPDA